MPLLPLFAAMMMQVGVDPMGGRVPGIPEELRNRPPRRGTQIPPAAASPALGLCLETARTDPAKAVDLAQAWVARTTGAQRAAGRHCLGVALSNQGDWAGASRSFLAARDEGGDKGFKARMGALAGSALLAGGNPEEALAALDLAVMAAGNDPALAGAILEDRASALVMLARPAEAAGALAEAGRLVPEDAAVWLLSATLSRRQHDLAAAQGQIEKAAALDPKDPAIGLEAGVIAALGNRDLAARRSFQSVIAAAPDSPQAKTAQNYLEQLDPRSSSEAVAPPKPRSAKDAAARGKTP